MPSNLKTVVTVTVMGAAIFIGGCSVSRGGPEGVHSYAWYKKDPSAALKENKWCKRTQVHPANPLKWLASSVGRSCSNAASVVDDLKKTSYTKS
jgi:hypothetical protein